ncbi:ribonuclease H-like family, partial [Trichomonas vaginalis G3]|uniref:ribonuclease H-like family n=1 Tax=Trichomonas vaginalis (strain ATCC PRA-98 / G3) TaxID=412133 RepID=UPI0021E61CB3
WFENINRAHQLNHITNYIPSELNPDDPPVSYPQQLLNIQYLPDPLPQMPSHHMVQRAFEELGKMERRGPRKPKGRTRYVACLPNQIWHVDIHFLHGNRNEILYAAIDDATRLVMEWQHLSSKHATQTVKVVERAIRRFGKPHTIWSDNGRENRGVFLRAMRVKGIRNVYITPHCPYQNGKIERLWPGIEKKGLSWNKIHAWVMRYNTKPHRAFPTHRVNGKLIHYSPEEMWMKGPKWEPGMPAKWIIDDKEYDFLPGSVQAKDIPELECGEEEEERSEEEEKHEEEKCEEEEIYEEDILECDDYESPYEEESCEEDEIEKIYSE